MSVGLVFVFLCHGSSTYSPAVVFWNGAQLSAVLTVGIQVFTLGA